MYKEQFGHSVAEDVVEKDGIEFSVTRGSPPSISTLEQALGEIKSMYAEKFGHSVAEKWLSKMALRSCLCKRQGRAGQLR